MKITFKQLKLTFISISYSPI